LKVKMRDSIYELTHCVSLKKKINCVIKEEHKMCMGILSRSGSTNAFDHAMRWKKETWWFSF
jgi:hypothetical protein